MFWFAWVLAAVVLGTAGLAVIGVFAYRAYAAIRALDAELSAARRRLEPRLVALRATGRTDGQHRHDP